MMKALAATACAGLFVAPALAHAQPSSNPQGTPPATAPSEDPRQLYLDTVR